ncbi:MAG: DNA-binding protein [Phycisphaerales bacterium]|nr:MAG: DNA-binding protein [Phycisphaerales bacterium]
MAKMFYTLEEAAQRLGKSVEEVQEMATSGQIQEFRADGKLMLKKDQVDLLAGDDDDIDLADSAAGDIGLADSGNDFDLGDASAASSMGGKSKGGTASPEDDDDFIPLADSSGDLEPISLSSSGSAGAINLEDSTNKGETGISIFDPDETEDADPAAQTQVTDGPDLGDFATTGGSGFDSSASGSGLLDLTREGDDTSLGADLMDDVYAGGDDGAGAETFAGGDLFESPSAATGFTEPAAPMMVAAEPYDGAGSGLVGGLALGMIAALALAATVTILAFISHSSNISRGGMVETIAGNWVMYTGIAAGVVLLAALIGWALGRRS